MKKTKIIATIGPASKDEETIRQIILNGVDIIRLNLKYTSHEFCEKIVKMVNKINKELNSYVSILFDLQGPDIMIGKLSGGSATLNISDKIRIYMNDILGDSTKISINYPFSKVKHTNFMKIEEL